MNIFDFGKMKKAMKKISMITCYDYTSARILSQTSADCLLVGDSVAMTMHGFQSTISATIEMMCFHTAAVSRGNKKFIQHLVTSGVPVMGHIGLTPQFVNMLGGYKVQGKTQESAERLKKEALLLQELGCFSEIG